VRTHVHATIAVSRGLSNRSSASGERGAISSATRDGARRIVPVNRARRTTPSSAPRNGIVVGNATRIRAKRRAGAVGRLRR